MGQMLLQFAGTAIGTFFGGPVGGTIGGAIGGMLGQLLFPPKPQQIGPRLKDTEVVSSAYGQPIFDSWGTFAIPGLLIGASRIREKKKKIKAGKGMMMGGPTGFTYVYDVDVDYLFRRHVAAGFLRVWLHTKLIRNLTSNADLSQIVASGASFAGGSISFHLGGETQLPDPTMEAIYGVGQVPAHRGVARIVVKALKLSNFGNSVPPMTAEVYDSGTSIPTVFPPAEFVSGNVALSFDYVDDQGETISLVADLGQSAEAFENYSNKNAYYWRRFTPEGTFMEERMFAGPDNIILHIPSRGGQTDVKATAAFGGQMLHIFDFEKATVITCFLDPYAFFINTWVYKHDMILVADDYCRLMLFPSSGSVPSPAVAIAFVDYSQPGRGLAGADATDSFYYIHVIDSGVTKLLVLDKTSLGIVATHTISGLVVDTMTVVSDDDIYFVRSDSNQGPVTFYRLNPDKVSVTQIMQIPLFGGASYNAGFNAHMLVKNGVFYVGNGRYHMSAVANVINTDGVPLSTVVGNICLAAGIPADRIDVNELTDIVWGYARDRTMSGVELMRPLVTHYFFDPVESGLIVKFLHRGRSTSFVVPVSDLGAYEPGQEPPDLIDNMQLHERKLPMLVKVQYIQRDKDYERGEQYDERVLGDYREPIEVQLPISMPDNEAKETAARLIRVMWTERNQRSIKLNRKYIQIEPTDVIEIPV